MLARMTRTLATSTTATTTASRNHHAKKLLALRTFSTMPTSNNSNSSNQNRNNSTTTTGTTSTLKPWTQKMVESNGDYRAEAYLEEYIGGPLYSCQDKLPRLPVPTLTQSLDMLLPTALPLVESTEEEQNLLDAVEIFPKQAEQLQHRLLARATEFSDSSWLQLWWNQMGYVQVRDSIVINVSYFFYFNDDPTCQIDPIKRGAAMISACTDFRKQIITGQYPAEVVGKGDRAKTLCSTSFKYMFHACRIPKLVQDSYKIYDPSQYCHVIVVCRNQFYKLNLICPDTQLPYPLAAIEAGLQQCVEHAYSDSTTTPLLELGWCTSSNRDDWAKARTALLEAGGIDMEQALETLESGAFMLCLDLDDTSISRTECAKMLLHGNSTSTGGNRWFDKSIQLVVNKNAKAGFVGEHSMMDGMPMVGLADHITKTTYDSILQKEKNGGASSSSSGVCTVEPIFTKTLQQTIRSCAEPLVTKAKEDYTTLVTNNALHVQSFQGYGSSFIKKAGYSPDAFVQMAIQLATYRLWGKQAGTYEATQVRPFLHGRTETTRSVSTESAAFCQKLGLRPAMDEHVESVRKEKLELLQNAVNAHVKYIGKAAQAQGVDRHLFGLSLCVQDGEQAPDLYSDPVFIRSKRWRVSTSHLTHPKFDGWGFGQVVPDGVGVAYSIHPRHCVFNIAALKETGWTDKLSELLEESLLELRTLIEMDQKPVSKL